MAKYLSKAGAIHLVNKVKENFVSSNEPVQAATYLQKNENAVSATQLETTRAISITDGVNTGTATNFDGTKNILLELPAKIRANH